MTSLEQPELTGLTLSRPGGPAKDSQSQVRAGALKMSVLDFLGKSYASLMSLDPDTLCWKTSQQSLWETEGDGADISSEPLPLSGMMRNGTCYQLEPLRGYPAERLTGGTASGSWPTPVASGSAAASMSAQAKEAARLHPQHRYTLATKVWEGLPTPSANEDAAGTPLGAMQRMLGNCQEVRGQDPEGWKESALCPHWTCWLMGLPLDWFDIPSRQSPLLPELPEEYLIGPTGCGPSAMDW